MQKKTWHLFINVMSANYNTIMIFTSNVGKNIYEDQSRDFSNVPIPFDIIKVSRFAHKETKTDVILKTVFQNKVQNQDVVAVTAHSFDTIQRVEHVTVMGGDGHFHSVPVHWVEYIPLENTDTFVVGDLESDDEISFRRLGHDGIIYARGLVSGDTGVNVDINKIKSQLKKD